MMQTAERTTYEHSWVAGLNRGDVAVADEAFDAHCVIHS